MSTNPKRLGKYELQMRLGQGGMAEVWKCFDPQLQRLVAIKFLHANLRSDPDFTNRFVREGQAIAALHHPNIVKVYDFQVPSPEDENSMAYMVMDHIEGSTLADYLRRTSYEQKFPTGEEIVRLFTSLGMAVDYAHQHHMIHRDIKPANILLDMRNTTHNSMGEPILTDFGIVKMLGGAAITSTGISMGTPLYISPEMVHGQAGNEKSDIYALGVILYEICTGEPPYRGDNPYVILAQRVTRPPDPPSQRNPHISPALDEVILRCLAMNPSERFASASELTAALAEAFDIPVPDLIRHTLSSRALTSDLLLRPDLPTIEASHAIAPVAVQVADARKSVTPITGSETVLSTTGANVVSTPNSNTQHETQPSGIDTQLDNASALPLSSHSETPLPVSETLPVALTPDVPTQVRQHKHWSFPGRILLLIVLVGAGLGTYTFLHKGPATTSPGALASVGDATFLSSGQLNSQNTAFINDGIQVHLSHVPNPAPGYRYYAWLQDHTGATTSIFLGALQDHQGNVTLSYIDSQHRNLLAYVGSFLITEQSASIIPTHLSHNRKLWRYSALIPQAPSSIDHLSYLDHLRHLLVFEPAIEHSQVHYGLDFWLLNTIQELSTDTLEMRDGSNLGEMRQSLVNIRSYLDGTCAHQELSSTPESTTPANGTLADTTSISLLDCGQEAKHLGYMTRAAQELNAMVKAPGVPAQDVQRAAQMSRYLNTMQENLAQMRIDVLQLANLDDAHLKQAQVLRNDLVNQANDVSGGRFDPGTQTLQPGIQQICNEITFLAHFDVSLYKTGG
jgi:serine/threonine protein kinase